MFDVSCYLDSSVAGLGRGVGFVTLTHPLLGNMTDILKQYPFILDEQLLAHVNLNMIIRLEENIVERDSREVKTTSIVCIFHGILNW